MKRVILLIMLIETALIAGDEKKLLSSLKENGAVLSYAPSVGKSLIYKSSSDNIIEYYAKDMTHSVRSNTTKSDTFMVEKVDSTGGIKFTVRFGKVSSTVLEGGEIKEAEESNELEGQSLTIELDGYGKIVDWTGLATIGFNEAGIDEGELIANSYATFGILHLPTETLKVGSSWTRTFPTKLSTKKGSVNQDIEKVYTLKGFEIKDKHICAKIGVDVKITVSGEGEITDGGERVKYSTKGNGKGKGEVYFDIQGGYLYKGSTNWILDYEIKTETGERVTYSQETKESWTLVEKE